MAALLTAAVIVRSAFAPPASPLEPPLPSPRPAATRTPPIPVPSPTVVAAPAARSPAPPASRAFVVPAPDRRAASARPPATRPEPASTPVPAAASGSTGSLRLLVVPPSQVTVDATELGTLSVREIALAPGPHVVRILHPDYEPLQRKVTIRAGERAELVIDLSEKGIRRQP